MEHREQVTSVRRGGVMHALLERFWKDESGQGLAEYALLVAAVVVLVISVSALFGEDVQNLLDSIGTVLDEASEDLI